MDERTLFLKLWVKEAATTRKVISRIPEGRADYRPDPKARSARELAWLLIREDVVLVEGLEKGAFEWVELPPPSTVKEILETYDRSHEDLSRRLHGVDSSRWEGQVPFMFDGKAVMSAAGHEGAWGFFLDQIHHRGQLSTYLRPMGSTVPQIYGPSADEPM